MLAKVEGIVLNASAKYDMYVVPSKGVFCSHRQPGSWTVDIEVHSSSRSSENVSYVFDIEHAPSGLMVTDNDVITGVNEAKVKHIGALIGLLLTRACALIAFR